MILNVLKIRKTVKVGFFSITILTGDQAPQILMSTCVHASNSMWLDYDVSDASPTALDKNIALLR